MYTFPHRDELEPRPTMITRISVKLGFWLLLGASTAAAARMLQLATGAGT